MRVEEVSDIAQLRKYAGAWKALAQVAVGASIFDSCEWILAWLETFGAEMPLRFLLVWDDDLLVGLAPMIVDRSKDPFCRAPAVVSGLHPYSYRANVLCGAAPEAVLKAMAAHLRKRGSFPRMVFPNAMVSGPVASVFPEIAARNGLATTVLPATPSRFLKVHGDWDARLKAKSSHLAKETRRKVKRFGAAGQAEIVVVTRPEQVEQAMRDVLTIDANSWKQTVDSSLSGNETLARLHAGFAAAAAESGLLRMYLLYLNQQPVAYIFGVVFRNEYYAFMTAYDTAHRPLSPGIVLFDRLFRDAHDEQLDAVDLGPGSGQRWKDEFANDVREHVDVCLFSPTRVVCRSCSYYRTDVKPFVRESMPGVLTVVRKIKAGVGWTSEPAGDPRTAKAEG